MKKPSKEYTELRDLMTFMDLSGLSTISFQLEGPRKTFPDFILTFDDKSTGIEITTAPIEKRMENVAAKRKFEKFIYPILHGFNIEADFMELDRPKILSADAYRYRMEIAEWVRNEHDTLPIRRQVGNGIVDIQNKITRQFGDCIVKLKYRNGKKKFGYYWELGNPYSLSKENLIKFYGNIANNIISAIKQKLKKYGKKKDCADLLIIKPVYWEPIDSADGEEMAKLRGIIQQKIQTHPPQGESLIEQIPQHFCEVWILMSSCTIQVFPI
jgi:hypothetical protein